MLQKEREAREYLPMETKNEFQYFKIGPTAILGVKNSFLNIKKEAISQY
jgi:hypothetical protein